MLKGRGRDPRAAVPPTPGHFARPSSASALRPPLARPEPDYEVVEFPGEQYVNAKLQPPPPPPPRPPTGHPVEAGASCGLCGGGGARVRCAECGRRALCASCDDMYHRHPKRRNHQRQALSSSQLRDERPPLPPKTAPPVPPPRRNKATPSPKPQDNRRATLSHITSLHSQTPAHLSSLHSQQPTHLSALHNQQPIHLSGLRSQQQNHMSGLHSQPNHLNNHLTPQQIPQQIPLHLQTKMSSTPTPSRLGSMPFLPTTMPHPSAAPQQSQNHHNTLNHMNASWTRSRGSLQGFDMHPSMHMAPEQWEAQECIPQTQSWSRPLRRGQSVAELAGGATMGVACGGCAQCMQPWRYGSCASLDHPWNGWPPGCCVSPHPPHDPHMHHPHTHHHAPQTPQPYRRAENRTLSRAASRAGSRAASPALSVRSRASRRTKHRTPSPPSLPSSDADSESESEYENNRRLPEKEKPVEETIGTAPPPANSSWQCEHCTFVNEPGVRVCAVCCRTPTAAPKIVVEVTKEIDRLEITNNLSPPKQSQDVLVQQNGAKSNIKPKKERTSTGCGPSPPREETLLKRPINRLTTPTREQSARDRVEQRERHDMAVGPSPPREIRNDSHNIAIGPSPPREINKTIRVSPFREKHSVPEIISPKVHSISVGPSPPREKSGHSSIGTSPSSSSTNIQKKSTGTSPPRAVLSATNAKTRNNVSNTGTSPPPQSTSTQTYDVPSTWERAPSASRSRPRRRFRDERRERSHSRHSLSSDTRESERSIRTAGDSGRWEWRDRERDSSPGAEWSATEGGRLARRASHLDLRRTRSQRRAGFYGSEAASPEPIGATRAASLEALAGANARRETERGLELARLMAEAERLGFSAAEVQAALAQSPAAPLAWLRSRWPSLCAGVRAAAHRLAPNSPVSEVEARAALARHRGAMWPAVTECVERSRRRAESVGIGSEARVRGRVWGSPAGVDDDAAPPRRESRHESRPRAEDSSDELEAPTRVTYPDDDWMYLPDVRESNRMLEPWKRGSYETPIDDPFDIRLSADGASVDDVLLRDLLSEGGINNSNDDIGNINNFQLVDFIQTENDFIDAYNALTRASPLPTKPIPAEVLVEVKHNSISSDGSERDVNNKNRKLNKNKQTLKTKNENIEISQVQKPKMNINFTQPLKPHKNKTLLTSASPETNVLKETVNSNKLETMSVIEINDTHDSRDHDNSNSDANKITEDKPNNLNDIVDDTQRLIQQMKEEINSDIHSLDSRNISQSEAETSSNEEQESSYSDSDERSEHTSSDEKEISTSDDEEEIRAPSETHQSNLNRTSSEDNEQFEEAMDHLDNQIEDFKHANIEILDSIARSLQDDHTLTVEKNIQQPSYNNHNNNNIEDHNNNSFVIVNSFEEIYAQLNSASTNDKQTISKLSQEDNLQNIDVTEQVKTNLPINAKEQISTQSHSTTILREKKEEYHQIPKTIAKIDQTNINILQGNAPIVSQNIEFIDTSNDDNQALPDKTEENNTVDHELANNMITERETYLEKAHESINEKGVMEEVQLLPKQIIDFTLLKLVTPSKIIINEIKEPIFNAILEQLEVDNPANNLTENAIKLTTHISPDRPSQKIVHLDITGNDDSNGRNQNESINITNKSSSSESSTSISSVEENTLVKNNAMIARTLPVNLPSEENNVTEETQSEPPSPVDESPHTISEPESIILNTDNTRQTTPENITHPVTSANTIPNQITNKMIISKDFNNKSNVVNKSNIPKLIKTIQNNKPKPEKMNAKLIASKVPIRRVSIKQYPAPSPPKTHFGNIQRGHVKQLQTKLFTADIPKTNTIELIEVKATTSAIYKKKPAPAPPQKHELKEPSPSKLSPPKQKKKNYFRETCRTEDEWTESDSDDSQPQIIRTSEENEENVRHQPSPPPPITLRRVSGQLIDLARVRLLEGSPERQARMLLAEGATETWEQAQLAVELVSRGADPPAALLAALECMDLDAALTYLHQDCELCASRLPEHEMVSMLRCTHRCCRECARLYFTVQITERSIADCVCPYCKVPELESLPEDAWLEYFAHLDILLKTLLDTEVHELFQRKLRDRTLAKDPNFRWCMECSSGFFVHPKQKKVRCPECRSISCASCRKQWTQNHEGLTCEQYTTWLEDNDPEVSVTAIQKHLKENGLECPRCHFKYSLSRGGCMHFTCTQCKYEFCYGCGKPFMMGARCGLSEYCAKLGLHAHHPRNCLFYLRDKEPHELQTLLQMNNVTYETEPPAGCTGRCPVQLQRETPTGLIDGTCGSDAPPNYAGLCKTHYVEYLAAQARTLDPIPIMDVPELVAELRRRALPLPERGPWDTDPIYAGMCAEIVKEKIPLD